MILPTGPQSTWELAQRRFACDHLLCWTTVKIASNGAKSYWRQCQHCGEGVKNIRKTDLSPREIATAPPFDEAKRDQYQTHRLEFWQTLQEQEKAKEAWEWQRRYEAHVNMANPKWRSLRERVFKRAGGICEGCGLRAASQVHHLTYEHLGDEFLWELQAVCIPCHERVHGDQGPSP